VFPSHFFIELAEQGHRTADFLGRRYAMTVECGVFIIGVLVQILAFKSWVQFALGRLISGFAVGALSAAVPMVRCYITVIFVFYSNH
jgi:MFS family permease